MAIIGQMKKITYSLLRILIFRKGKQVCINGQLIRFPIEYSRYYPEGYEIEKQKFIEANCHGMTLDLGAHIGLYTVIMSRLSTVVVAVEPSPKTRKALTNTLFLNNSSNVAIISNAISDKSGTSTIFMTNDDVSNANSLFVAGKPHKVNTVCIDSFGVDFNFIKIDIEGAELLALRGASRVLKKVQAMTIEIHPEILESTGQQKSEIWEILDSENASIMHEGKVIDKIEFERITGPFEIQVVFPMHGAEK